MAKKETLVVDMSALPKWEPPTWEDLYEEAVREMAKPDWPERQARVEKWVDELMKIRVDRRV